MSKKIFVSHVNEERSLALRVKESLESDFLGLVDVFASTDVESIDAGRPWLAAIEAALKESAMIVVLCSPSSISRPWINFEIGAAWALEKDIVPLCHSGLKPDKLPMPLLLLNGIRISDAEGLRKLYTTISKIIPSRVPGRSFPDLAKEWLSAEATLEPASVSAVAPAAAVSEEESILIALHRALSDPEYQWRTVAVAASEAGVSAEEAKRILRQDPTVKFTRNSAGTTMVALRSRVGE